MKLKLKTAKSRDTGNAGEAQPSTPAAERENWLAHRLAGELRDLVTAMLGYSELALAILEPEHPTRAHVEKIVSTGSRAALLIRRLEALNLAAFLQDVKEG